MSWELDRRDFLKSAIAGCAVCAGCAESRRPGMGRGPIASSVPGLVSPGCRTTRVRVAKVYVGSPGGLWPKPKLDLPAESRRYEAHFARMSGEFADVDFVGNEVVTSAQQARQLREKAADVDGFLIIHLSMGIDAILREILAAGKPTMVFAVPYSGHEWAHFGAIQKEKAGALMDCLLTSDLDQLAAAVRPIRAIQHLREAKIINITARPAPAEFARAIKDKFGTEVKCIGREPVLAAYESVPERQAWDEANRWIDGAVAVVEPSRDEIYRSCRLALAFEKILDEEKATVITADCYGTMYHNLPAFPCIGNVRLNNMGLGGICESDLRSAMTHILFQGLCGRPGFISDPTMDESKNEIILAHCLGTMKMDGPAGPSAPYKLRSIMERQEGAVPAVRMRIGEKVTQAYVVDANRILYFTGVITDTPELDRGCRTKIAVRIDGDPKKLWQNWSSGLHRVTCYGNITDDLRRFCRFKQVNLIAEA